MQRNCNRRGLVDPCNLVLLLHPKAVADYPERLETARYRAVSPAALGIRHRHRSAVCHQVNHDRDCTIFLSPVDRPNLEFKAMEKGEMEMEMMSARCNEINTARMQQGISREFLLPNPCFLWMNAIGSRTDTAQERGLSAAYA